MAQLEDQGPQILHRRPQQHQVPTHRGRGDGVGAGVQVVRHHLVVQAVQLGPALHRDPVGAGAADLGPHRAERRGKVTHVGLPRGVPDRGAALRRRRRHHDVLGPGDGRHIEVDLGAPQAFAVAQKGAVPLLDDGPQLAHPEHVLVHPAHPDVIAAGHGHHRLAGAGQERAQEQDRRPHQAGAVQGHVGPDASGGGEGHLAGPPPLHHDAQRLQDGDGVVDVGEDRDVAQPAGLGGEQ